MKTHDSKFLFRMISVPVVFGLLCALLANAAGAKEPSPKPSDPSFLECRPVPLANGRVGETVQICKVSAEFPKSAVRTGITTVEHVR